MSLSRKERKEWMYGVEESETRWETVRRTCRKVLRVVSRRSKDRKTHSEIRKRQQGKHGDPLVAAAVSKGNVQPGDDLQSLETRLLELLAVDAP